MRADDDVEGYEMTSRKKYSGTAKDMHDMRILGKTQVLNVSATN